MDSGPGVGGTPQLTYEGVDVMDVVGRSAERGGGGCTCTPGSHLQAREAVEMVAIETAAGGCRMLRLAFGRKGGW